MEIEDSGEQELALQHELCGEPEWDITKEISGEIPSEEVDLVL